MDPAGHLRSDIEQALGRHRLTDWQRKFLTDIHVRLKRSNGQARLTDKQWRKIFEILGKQTDPSAPVAPIQPSRPGHSRRTWLSQPRFRFGRRHIPRRIERLTVGLIIVAVLAVFQWLAGSHTQHGSHEPATAAASSAVAQPFTVTDGDTIHVVGEAKGTRLVGFNTPEKFTPQCANEQRLGERASDRLRELVAAGSTKLIKVACACSPSTEGSDRCNHGRSCGTLFVHGEDVGNILIREGLAVPFLCSGTRCPPTPRPWCG